MADTGSILEKLSESARKMVALRRAARRVSADLRGVPTLSPEEEEALSEETEILRQNEGSRSPRR